MKNTKLDLSRIELDLQILIFEEGDQHFVYSPSLDLTGYGDTTAKARKSFEITLNEYLRYTQVKGTLVKDLKKHKWKITGQGKKIKLEAPTLVELLRNNEHIQEIFNNHEFKKKDQRVVIPELA